MYHLKINIFYRNWRVMKANMPKQDFLNLCTNSFLPDKNYDIHLLDGTWLNFERILEIEESETKENETIKITKVLKCDDTKSVNLQLPKSEEDVLNTLFHILNCEPRTPLDEYTGPSLSVGHIIQFNDNVWWSVNSIGFKPLICKDKDAKIYTVQV